MPRLAGVLILAALFGLAPAAALAGAGCPCPPPPPPPPPPCNCTPPPPTVSVPGVNVFVAPTVVVNASVAAQARAAAFGSAAGQTFVGGGGGGGFIAPQPTGVIQRLNVVGGTERAAYEAIRTRVRKVMVEAVCVDDRMAPHPASQVFPDRDVAPTYVGELYRCIAGTHMQVTIADWRADGAFSGGATLSCRKGEALWRSAGGPQGPGGIACRPQIPARECNERSLLRRFGAGIKVLTLVETERYTAYREAATGSAASGLTLDGGVGGIQY